ncbi:DUF6030 family protein, partial [Hansschlegelia beijingensis]
RILIQTLAVTLSKEWQVARDWLGQSSPSEQSAAAPDTRDPFAALQPIAAAELLAPEPGFASAFVLLPTVKPSLFCKALGPMGLANPTFQGGTPPLSSWTCVTDLLKPVDGDEAAVSSLFVSARGDDPERIDTLRIKLNLLDESTAPVAKAIAKDLLRKIFWGFGFPTPDAALSALDELRDSSFRESGVRYDLRREFGAPRFNLVIAFPQRLGAGGEGRFLPPR